MDKDIATLSPRKGTVTPQPTIEAREEITYFYVLNPIWTRDIYQPTGETRLHNTTPRVRDGRGDHNISPKRRRDTQQPMLKR